MDPKQRHPVDLLVLHQALISQIRMRPATVIVLLPGVKLTGLAAALVTALVLGQPYEG
ncbi:hypothetical protein KAR10_00195 [bacterium]|nr:hypothetical protein [bacterium]